MSNGSEARPSWFSDALSAIDAANAADPNRLVVESQARPKAQAEGQLVAQWVQRLDPSASPALLLAARAHHIRRWLSPRESYPEGRAGYLRWRRDLHEVHAREAASVLLDAGATDDAIVTRVQDLVRKRNLATDPEVQTLEDAICLVFLETQLEEFVARLDDDKAINVIRKTVAKMSGRALEAALQVPLQGRAADLVARALTDSA